MTRCEPAWVPPTPGVSPRNQVNERVWPALLPVAVSVALPATTALAAADTLTEGQVVTVTVAVLLFALPQLFDTRAQYEVVVPGDTESEVLFVPVGLESSGDAPMNHCTVRGVVPVALTEMLVDAPELIVLF
jgi:hypothetical protein